MIYLARHCITDYNEKGIVLGHTDMSLNENGLIQSVSLITAFSDIKLDKIYCSDLRRTKQTAYLINLNHSIEIIPDKRLRGYNYGTFENHKWTALTSSYWELFDKSPNLFNAESSKDVYLRIKDFFESIDFDDKDILIVTHGGALRVIIYYLENKDNFDDELFKSKYSDIYLEHGKFITYKDGVVDYSNIKSRSKVRSLKENKIEK